MRALLSDSKPFILGPSSGPAIDSTLSTGKGRQVGRWDAHGLSLFLSLSYPSLPRYHTLLRRVNMTEREGPALSPLGQPRHEPEGITRDSGLSIGGPRLG